MMTKDDYCVRIIDLPYEVRGFVAMSPEGFWSIYLNAHLSQAEQRKTFLHELRHIVRDDFYNEYDIRSIEE